LVDVFHRQLVELLPQCTDVYDETPAAWHGFDLPLRCRELAHVLSLLVACEDLEGAQLWIDEPVEAHPELRVVVEFLHAIAADVAELGGHDLDHDVGRNADRAACSWFLPAWEVNEQIWHPTASRA